MYISLSKPANHLHSTCRKLTLKSSSRNPLRLLRTASALAVAAILALVLFPATLLHAQVAGTGTIEGTILDPSGAVVSEATVTATNNATGLKFFQKTSDAGTYSIAALPAGTYTVNVEAVGFAPVRQEHLLVNALAQVGLNVTLQVGSAAQEVVVTAAPPDLQTENGTVETTIPQSTYNALPIAMNSSPFRQGGRHVKIHQ